MELYEETSLEKFFKDSGAIIVEDEHGKTR